MIYNNYVVVNVSPSTPGISISGNLLTSSVSNGNQWFLNGNLIAGATSSTYLANQSGSYTVEVTNSMGCNAESNAVNLIVTDVQDRTSLNNLIIHPNPAFNSIRVSNVQGLSSIRIFDSSAKLLLETKNLVIDLSSYSEGVYIIQVDSEGGVTNHRLIKINE